MHQLLNIPIYYLFFDVQAPPGRRSYIDKARAKNPPQTSKAGQGDTITADPGMEITSTRPRIMLQPAPKVHVRNHQTKSSLNKRAKPIAKAHFQWYFDAC
jgi:hypothetical protein